MTALKEFQRLEATGLWRASPDDQRREVIVSLGDATLTISDIQNRALAHWSIAAVKRANPSDIPAIFHPDGDPSETLELSATEAEMIDAIDRVLTAIDRRRPKPGKLRLTLIMAAACLVAAAAFLWAPPALMDYAAKVVPAVKRAEIGASLLTQITRVSGQPCAAPGTSIPLQRLSDRVLGADHSGRLIVLPSGVQNSTHLPGQMILLAREVIEDFEDPDVPAGFVLAERQRMAQRDPLLDLLEHAGLFTTLKLLTTGNVEEDALRDYAEHMLTRTPAPPDTAGLLAAFDAADLRSTPYAYARDLTGETVLDLVEADPHAQSGSRLVLSDADWIRLQGICGA